MTQGPRRSAWLRGRRAEWLAAWWLRLKGYRILARDLRTPVGEIDLIARRGRVLALVEVKARPSLEEAAWSLTPFRAALAVLQRDPAYGTLDMRFDVVLVAPGHRPRHIMDAWRPESEV
jgi:putative endonuclease